MLDTSISFSQDVFIALFRVTKTGEYVFTLYQTIPSFNENILGKGENAGNQPFLLFPQCFLSFLKQISIFELHLSSLSAF